MKVVLDTNILIDLANARPQARVLLAEPVEEMAISTVSWIETLVRARSEDERQRLIRLLETFTVLETNREVAQHAVKICQQYRLHLPDAIIWATAKATGACLLTRDTNYPSTALDIRIPYTL